MKIGKAIRIDRKDAKYNGAEKDRNSSNLNAKASQEVRTHNDVSKNTTRNFFFKRDKFNNLSIKNCLVPTIFYPIT